MNQEKYRAFLNQILVDIMRLERADRDVMDNNTWSKAYMET
jgi:hypothetical protein